MIEDGLDLRQVFPAVSQIDRLPVSMHGALRGLAGEDAALVPPAAPKGKLLPKHLDRACANSLKLEKETTHVIVC